MVICNLYRRAQTAPGASRLQAVKVVKPQLAPMAKGAEGCVFDLGASLSARVIWV